MSLAEAERAALSELAEQHGMAGAQILIGRPDEPGRVLPAAKCAGASPQVHRAAVRAGRAVRRRRRRRRRLAAVRPDISSALNLDCEKLSEHHHLPPGAEPCPEALGAQILSPAHRPHDVGLLGGIKEETAVRLIYGHLMHTSSPSRARRSRRRMSPATTGCAAPSTRRASTTTRRRRRAPRTRRCSSTARHSSKTPEACVTAWCATFVDGCLVVQGVRNKGGRISGSTDMKEGIDALNGYIKELFEYEVSQGNIDLPASDYTKFQLDARRSSDKEFLEFDPTSRRLKRPQVYIICMNASQIKNMTLDTAVQDMAKAGALAGYVQIMKGETRHPYPPKCNDQTRSPTTASTGRSRACTSSSTRTTSTARTPATSRRTCSSTPTRRCASSSTRSSRS